MDKQERPVPRGRHDAKEHGRAAAAEERREDALNKPRRRPDFAHCPMGGGVVTVDLTSLSVFSPVSALFVSHLQFFVVACANVARMPSQCIVKIRRSSSQSRGSDSEVTATAAAMEQKSIRESRSCYCSARAPVQLNVYVQQR